MFGIGKDTAMRDTIGITIAIVTAILLLGVAERVPAPVAAPVEAMPVQEAVLETPATPELRAKTRATSPVAVGRI